jgi:hypothetical protein
MDSGEDLVHLSLGYLGLFDKALKAFSYHVHSIIDKSLFDVSHRDFVFADLSGYLGDSVTHQASAQNSDSLDFHSFSP